MSFSSASSSRARAARSPVSRTTQAGRFSIPGPPRSAASSSGSGTTGSPDSRAVASGERSGPTSTGRSCRGTRGSPTGSSRRPWRTPREGSLRSWSHSRTSSRRRPSASRPSARAGAEGVAESGIPEGHPIPPPAASVSPEGVRVGRGPCRMRADQPVLGHPHLAEVDRRVTRLPPLEEPLDRRVKRHGVELMDMERAMAAHRLVLGRDLLERARYVCSEDHVDHVLALRLPVRRDRIDERNGTLQRYLDTRRKEPRLLPELAAKRPDEALPGSHTPTGQQPHLVLSFLVAEQQDPAAPAEDRRNADPRLAHAQWAVDPKPCAPRSLAASSSTSTRRTVATGAITSCAMRIPGSTVKTRSRSVFRRTTQTSPR